MSDVGSAIPPFRLTLLAAVPYHFPLQSRNQQLATELARQGISVCYVAPPTPRAMLRHWRAPWRERRAGPIRLVWPWPQPPLRWQLALGLTDWIARVQAARIGVPSDADVPHVVCVTTPLWQPVCTRLARDLLIYDCLDDPAVHARRGQEELYASWHAESARAADVVVTVSPYLSERVRALTERPVVVCGNGVDLAAFSPDAVAHGLAPHLCAGLSPDAYTWLDWRRRHPNLPVAGFLGSIDRWVDTQLVALAARALPDVQFVLAGPPRRREYLAPLAGCGNVHVLGPVPYATVPAFLTTFDVGLIPFHPGLIAACADPLKTYEYCALGKPVVSSVQFALDDPAAPIRVATAAQAFVEAIREALDDRDPRQQVARIGFARRHAWSARATEFRSIIEKHLALTRPAAPTSTRVAERQPSPNRR